MPCLPVLCNPASGQLRLAAAGNSRVQNGPSTTDQPAKYHLAVFDLPEDRLCVRERERTHFYVVLLSAAELLAMAPAGCTNAKT